MERGGGDGVRSWCICLCIEEARIVPRWARYVSRFCCVSDWFVMDVVVLYDFFFFSFSFCWVVIN